METLIKNQSVVQVKLHWINFVKPLAVCILTFPFAFLFLPYVYIGNAFGIVVSGLFLLLFLKFLFQYFYIKNIEINMFHKFISLKEGVFSKNENNIPLSKIEEINTYQSFLGRFLNYGVLYISTGEIIQSYRISNPSEIKNILLSNIKYCQNGNIV